MLMVKRLWRLLKISSISVVSTYLMHYDLMEKNIPSHQNAVNLLCSAKLHMQDMYTMQRSAICSNIHLGTLNLKMRKMLTFGI